MLILNPTLRKYRTKPKRQGYLQKALLQIGKVQVNFGLDDITNNYEQKESAIDEEITGIDVEMLETEQVNEDKDKTEIISPHVSPEKASLNLITILIMKQSWAASWFQLMILQKSKNQVVQEK